MTDYFLDITDKMCPMTFVKTKLLVERFRQSASAQPLENVPRSLKEIGQEIVELEEEEPDIWLLTLRKAV